MTLIDTHLNGSRRPFLTEIAEAEDQFHRLDQPIVELVITQGRASHLVRSVSGPVFLIGASSECDLVLGDPMIPAVHSYLYLTDRGIRFRRLGHPPEIRVNGQTVEFAWLESNDRIDIGPFQFRLRLRDSVAQERTDYRQRDLNRYAAKHLW